MSGMPDEGHYTPPPEEEEEEEEEEELPSGEEEGHGATTPVDPSPDEVPDIPEPPPDPVYPTVPDEPDEGHPSYPTVDDDDKEDEQDPIIPEPPPVASDEPDPVVVPDDPIYGSPEPSKDKAPLATDATTAVLREAAVDQYINAAGELLKEKQSGKITQRQYDRQLKKLETRHIENIRRIDRRTAPKKWYEQAQAHVGVLKAGLAGYATRSATEILKMRARGEITPAQHQEMISQLEKQHLANLLGVDEGKLEGTPFTLSYTVPGKPAEPKPIVGRREEHIGPGEEGVYFGPIPKPTFKGRVIDLSDIGEGMDSEMTWFAHGAGAPKSEWQQRPVLAAGPGKGPKPGTIGWDLQVAFNKQLEAFEESSASFSLGLRTTGQETWAEAGKRWEAGDEAGALLPAVAAIGMRFSTAAIEEATFPFRPKMWARTAGSLFEGGTALIKDPRGTAAGVAKALAEDPLILAELASALAIGWVGTKGVQALTPATQLSRLDDLELNVRRTAMELDEVPGGATVLRIPEVDITGTVATKRVPKIVGEIMEAELKDLPKTLKTTILGIEESTGLTIVERIDIPTSAIDDIMKGRGTWLQRQRARFTGRGPKTTTVEAMTEMPGQVLDVEVLKVGQETGYSLIDDYVKTGIEDQFKLKKTELLSLEAKELGEVNILDDITTRGFTESAEEAGRLGSLELDIPERKIVALQEVVDDAGMKTLVPLKKGVDTGDVFKYTPPREPTARMIITETMGDVPVRISKIDLGDLKITQLDVDRWLSVADEGPPVDFQSLWGIEGRKGLLEPGLHKIDVKGRAAVLAEEVIDEADAYEFIPRDPNAPKTPLSKTFGDLPEKVPPKPRTSSVQVMLKKSVEEQMMDEITAGGPAVTKMVKPDVIELPPGLGSIARSRIARAGPPSRFDAGDMPSAFPGYVHTTKGVMPNPFTFEPSKDELKRRTKDRKKKAEVQKPKPKEDLIPDIIFGTKPKPKAVPAEDIIFKPKADVKPIEVPDIIYDQKETPIVVPDVDLDEIVKPIDVVIPVTVPGQIQVPMEIPIVVPMPIETITPRPPGYVPPPPPPPPYLLTTERRLLHPEWEKPAWGVEHLGRLLHIGTPQQALRGAMRIFGPPRPPTKKTKKKKKNEEEDDFLLALFGGRR